MSLKILNRYIHSKKQFLSEKVSLLKLDVEGAEELILQDIKSQMHKINQIFLEFHVCEAIKAFNNLERTLELLQAQHFELHITPGEVGIFPRDVLAWVGRHQPSLYHIQANRERVEDERRGSLNTAVESQRC
jgi:hypothetical protein